MEYAAVGAVAFFVEPIKFRAQFQAVGGIEGEAAAEGADFGVFAVAHRHFVLRLDVGDIGVAGGTRHLLRQQAARADAGGGGFVFAVGVAVDMRSVETGSKTPRLGLHIGADLLVAAVAVAVGTGGGRHLALHAVARRLFGDDVDDAAHRVGTVQRRHRPFNDFDALNHRRGNAVHIVGIVHFARQTAAVQQPQRAGGADAAQVDRAFRHRAAGREGAVLQNQPRRFGKHVFQRRRARLLDFLGVDHLHGGRYLANRPLGLVGADDYRLQLLPVFDIFAISRHRRQRRHNPQHTAFARKNRCHHHSLLLRCV